MRINANHQVPARCRDIWECNLLGTTRRLDLGRRDDVQQIFSDRRPSRGTPGLPLAESSSPVRAMCESNVQKFHDSIQ